MAELAKFELFSEVRKCPACKANPLVLLTKKQIPCCKSHWLKIAVSDLEWSADA